jgi:osmoprotectant transport system substrate-binding protein
MWRRLRRLGAASLVLFLVAAACTGGTSDGEPAEGPTITVASFNFPESVILAEIYAQALEEAGYPVERRLNLGSRELIFPELEAGNIDFIPEYVGSSLVVGFGLEAPGATDEAVERLREAFSELGMTVLEPTPGEDTNVFVVTGRFAQENGVTSLGDLAGLGEIVLGGPPECENRPTCYAGLVDRYGLDNLVFESIAEGSARIAALEAGEIDVALLFSTQPVIKEKGFVALEDPNDVAPPENIVPVVADDVIAAYGDDLVDLIDSISALITTDVLLDLNGRVELEAQEPADVARDWLQDNGFLSS